ncbi:MAG: hypothetical protein WC843_03325 [Candidatus Gracilibacteria bacterium]|jgi:hypothetical protein
MADQPIPQNSGNGQQNSQQVNPAAQPQFGQASSQQMGMNPGMGGQMMPPPPVEDTTPANFQIGSKLPQIIAIKVPDHTLKFDEQNFLHLLAGSISLTKDEKKRIIESIPKLKQSQVDELIRIFEEERRKFAELSTKHVEQLKKLEKQHYDEWMDLELSQKAQEKQSNDQAQAEEIRKKLGL